MGEAPSYNSIAGVKTELVTSGRGKPLLFLHGGEGLEACRPVIDLLAKDFSVTAASHPGFGGTDLPDGYSTVDDLAYFYLDLMDERRIADAVVVGCSLGGWIAAEIAVKTTASISHLVLVDPVGVKSDSEENRITDVFALSEAQMLGMAFHAPEAFRVDYSTLSEESLVRVARDRESMALFCWSPYMHNPKLRRRLHRINVPALVLAGESDRITPPGYGRSYAASIPGAQFKTVERAGHCPHIERPAAVADDIRHFVVGS